MGQCLCCSKTKELSQSIEYLTFDRSVSRIRQISQSEMFGVNDEMSFLLDRSLRELLVQNANHANKYNTPYYCEGGECKYLAPPLLDKYWQLAICNTTKYSEMCDILVGGILDREPTSTDDYRRVNHNVMPYLQYNYRAVELDDNSYLYASKDKVPGVIFHLYQTYNFDKLTPIVVRQLTDIAREYLDNNSGAVKQQKLTSWIQILQDEMISQLPSNLANIIYLQYCQSNRKDLIIEYVKFLIMIKVSKNYITPSDSIDWIWRTHQADTLSYRIFSRKYFAQQLTYRSIDDENITQYYQTLFYYNFLFGHQPPKNIWPLPEDRFQQKGGSWLSIYRLAQVIQNIKKRQEFYTELQVTRLITELYTYDLKQKKRSLKYVRLTDEMDLEPYSDITIHKHHHKTNPQSKILTDQEQQQITKSDKGLREQLSLSCFDINLSKQQSIQQYEQIDDSLFQQQTPTQNNKLEQIQEEQFQTQSHQFEVRNEKEINQSPVQQIAEASLFDIPHQEDQSQQNSQRISDHSESDVQDEKNQLIDPVDLSLFDAPQEEQPQNDENESKQLSNDSLFDKKSEQQEQNNVILKDDDDIFAVREAMDQNLFDFQLQNDQAIDVVQDDLFQIPQQKYDFDEALNSMFENAKDNCHTLNEISNTQNSTTAYY